MLIFITSTGAFDVKFTNLLEWLTLAPSMHFPSLLLLLALPNAVWGVYFIAMSLSPLSSWQTDGWWRKMLSNSLVFLSPTLKALQNSSYSEGANLIQHPRWEGETHNTGLIKCRHWSSFKSQEDEILRTSFMCSYWECTPSTSMGAAR